MPMKKRIETGSGEFVGTKINKKHVTLWVEGRDQDGPSVAGTMLTIDTLDELIGRLARLAAELRYVRCECLECNKKPYAQRTVIG